MTNRANRYDLAEAIQQGDIPEMRRLVQLGVDLNAVSLEYNQNPLGFAARRNDVAMIQALLDCGADPDQDDYEGDTPTEIAIRGRHYEALQLLLDFGETSAREARSIYALHKTTEQGEADLILRLLDAGVNIDAPDAQGYSPLITAIGRFAHLSCMAHLPDRTEVRAEIVRLLLKRGANVDFTVAAGHSAGLTALHCAASQGYMPLVGWLREAGAHITLPIAAMIGDTETVRTLLALGIAPDTPDFAGNTPLHCAAEYGHTETVQLLLEQGANLFLRNDDDVSPLYLAACAGHPRVVRALLDYGADQEKDTVILQHAAASGRCDVVLLLLQSGWNIDGDDMDHLTPLMEAAVNDLPDMVRFLIAHGADINRANQDEYTALMCAAQAHSLQAGRALMEAGADIHPLIEYNMTAFVEDLKHQASH